MAQDAAEIYAFTVVLILEPCYFTCLGLQYVLADRLS